MYKLLFALSDIFCDSIDENYENINQATVLGYICTNRIVGSAYKNLYKCSVNWQNECIDVLKTIYEKNIEKSKIYKQYVKEVANMLNKADFEYALLKGAYLSTVLYEEGMRTSNDVDVLINEKNIEKCKCLLEAHGFIQGHAEGNTIRPASRREIVMSRMNYGETVPFVKKVEDKILEIDINFSLNYKPENSDSRVEKFLERREYVKLDNSAYFTLNQYDFFIHLCCHLYKEATTISWVEKGRDLQLYKFSDINLFMRNVLSTLDMNILIDRINEYQVQEECYYTITNAVKIYPKISELKFYNALIEQIKPINLDFLSQVIEPTTGKRYYYHLPFEEWFFTHDKVAKLI